jgi:hypothetical protein
MLSSPLPHNPDGVLTERSFKRAIVRDYTILCGGKSNPLALQPEVKLRSRAESRLWFPATRNGNQTFGLIRILPQRHWLYSSMYNAAGNNP